MALTKSIAFIRNMEYPKPSVVKLFKLNSLHNIPKNRYRTNEIITKNSKSIRHLQKIKGRQKIDSRRVLFPRRSPLAPLNKGGQENYFVPRCFGGCEGARDWDISQIMRRKR